jgi:hypothetical protein
MEYSAALYRTIQYVFIMSTVQYNAIPYKGPDRMYSLDAMHVRAQHTLQLTVGTASLRYNVQPTQACPELQSPPVLPIRYDFFALSSLLPGLPLCTASSNTSAAVVGAVLKYGFTFICMQHGK